jgi:hypothetical protein
MAHDELLSVTKYQSRGPLHALTTYDEPNNHILYNALTAALPKWIGTSATRPLVIPIASTWSLFGLLGFAVWKRRRPLASAAIVCLLVANTPLISLWLSARGYGFVALQAAVATFAFLSFAELGTGWQLAALAGASVLGIWTVPTFLLFTGPLLGLAIVARPGLRTAGASLLAAAATIAIHLPVLRAMKRSLSAYGAEWGVDFASSDAVATLVRLTFLPLPESGLPAWTGWAAAAVVAALLVRMLWAKRPEARPFLHLALAMVTFLALCLVLRSPVFRSTVFIAIPLALLAVLSADDLVRRAAAPLRIAGSAAAIAYAAWLVGSALARKPYEPAERWKQVAETIERTFPPGTPLFPTLGELATPEKRWADFLGLYLGSPGDYPLAPAFDPAAFAGGRLIVHERPFTTERRLAAGSLPPGAVAIRIPQEYVEFQVLWVAPPRASSAEISGLELPLSTSGDLTLSLEPGRRYRSALLVFDRADDASRVSVSVRPTAPGAIRNQDVLRFGEVVIVPLGDSEATALVLRAPSGSRCRPVRAWVYPTSWDEGALPRRG